MTLLFPPQREPRDIRSEMGTSEIRRLLPCSFLKRARRSETDDLRLSVAAEFPPSATPPSSLTALWAIQRPLDTPFISLRFEPIRRAVSCLRFLSSFSSPCSGSCSSPSSFFTSLCARFLCSTANTLLPCELRPQFAPCASQMHF